MSNDNDDNVKYSAEYDSCYDAETGEWLENKCDDPECEFCANRPDNAIKDNENDTQDN